MQAEELEILLRPEVQQAIEQNIERDPIEVALDKGVPHAREVATQIKYLQRARTKLPSLYAARGIIPQRAFEQASSEQTAAAKRIQGERLLELTCGLGIDTAALARRFKHVVTLERDALLAEITRENLRRQGIDNVEVITASAEEYVAQCTEHFDWIYADPDRRNEQGRRVVKLEECSPNMLSLMPTLQRLADKIAIKNSPLFDVAEAFRLFEGCSVEVISLMGECKEVMIYIGGPEQMIAAEAVGRSRVEYALCEVDNSPCEKPFADDYTFLIIPDVALQKARLVCHSLRGVADVWSENSFGFARTQPKAAMGRVENIARIESFDLKRLKKELKGRGVDIILRDFAMGVEEVRRRTGMRSGSEVRLALTKVNGKLYTIYLE